jgi:acyl-CoA hydrolase
MCVICETKFAVWVPMHEKELHIPAGKCPSESETIMTEVVYPNDANPMGMLHGGKLVQWMDTACAITAQSHAENAAATVSIDKMLFKKPAMVGDIVTIKAKMTRAFDSSMEVFVQAWSRKATGKESTPINEAYFTFVALDEHARPRMVPPILPSTEQEIADFEDALYRRQHRHKTHHN